MLLSLERLFQFNMFFFFLLSSYFCSGGLGYAASGGLYKFFYDFSSFSTFNKNIANMDALLKTKGWNIVFKTTHKDILKMHDLMGKNTSQNSKQYKKD